MQAASQHAPQQDAEGPSAQEEWESWCRFFEQMDQQGNRLDGLNAQLQRAVREERYGEAARLKGEQIALLAGDAAASLQGRMQEALAAEDYGAAAALRDEGFAWLEGWWWGKAHDDSVGHLLQVTAEYGRWTGKVYSARDLAEAMGWYDAGDVNGVLRWRGARGATGTATRMAPPGAGGGGGAGGGVDGAGGGAISHEMLEDYGAPLLEVFLRHPGDGEGADDGVGLVDRVAAAKVDSQPVCLWPGDGAGGGGLDPFDFSTSSMQLRGGGDAEALLSALSVNGSRQRRGLRSSGGSSGYVSSAAALLEELVSGGATITSGDDLGDGLEEGLFPRGLESEGSEEEGVGDGIINGISNGDPDVLAATVLTVSVDEDGVATITADLIPEADRAGLDELTKSKQQRRAVPDQQQQRQQLPREQLPRRQQEGTQGLSRSKFSTQWEQDEVEATLRALRGEDESSASPSSNAPSSAEPPLRPATRQSSSLSSSSNARGSSSSSSSGTGALGPKQARIQPFAPPPAPPLFDLQRHPAETMSLTRDRFVLLPRAAPAPPPSGTAPTAYPSDDLTREELPPRPASPTPPSPRASSSSGGGSSDGGAGEDEMWARVAEEVAKLQEERSGVAVPRRELAEAIRTVARRFVREGRLASDSVTRVRIVSGAASAAAAPPAAAARPATALGLTGLTGGGVATAAAAAAPLAPPSVTYNRLCASAAGAGVGAGGDPLSGLFIGSFGVHGPELLQLTRGIDDDGDECVVGTKVTGDDNVPCGQVGGGGGACEGGALWEACYVL